MLNGLFIGTHIFISACYVTVSFLIYRGVKQKQQHLSNNPLVVVTGALFFTAALGHLADGLSAILLGEERTHSLTLAIDEGFALLTAIVAAAYLIVRRQYSIVIDDPVLLAETQNQLQQANADLGKMNANLEGLVLERAAELLEINEHLKKEIAERQQMEIALRENEERFRQLAENINDIFWIVDAETQQTLYISPTYEEIFGRSREAIYQQSSSFFDAIYPDDRDRVLASWKQHPQEGQQQEYRICKPDGSIRWLRDRAFPIQDETGKVYRLAGIAEDITESKQAAQELQRQNLRSQLVGNVALKVRQSLQLEEILQTTVTEVRELFQTDRVLIFQLWSDGSGTIVNEAVAPGWPAILAENITDACFNEKYIQLYRQGRVRVIPDVENSDMQPCHIELLQRFAVKANLVVPILQGDSLWGLLIAQQCAQIRDWSNFEIELLRQLADQVAIALSQAQFLAALRESEKKYRSVVDNIKEVIFQTDLCGRWTFLNPAWTEVTGFSISESIGKNLLDYIYPEDRQSLIDLGLWVGEDDLKTKERTLPKIPHCRTEIRYQTQSQQIRWVELNAQLTLAPDNTIIGTSGTLNDITDRKRAEEEIRRALLKEKELNELKSRFVAMTSHEFRTPLSTILSSCELLQHYGHRWHEEKKIAHFHRIQTSVQQMTQLLNDVLIIGKAEAGKLEFNPTLLDVRQFCQDLVQELQLGLHSPRISFIEVNNSHHQPIPKVPASFSQYLEPVTLLDSFWEGALLQPSVPQVADPLSKLYLLDDKLLRHIFSNLLSNALKYSPPESTVYFELACVECEAIFKIQDSGIGVPPEDQPHLFESFHRASNVGNVSGTGLGLAIVKKCVDLHDGKIVVDSKVGVGTTFIVSLPLRN